MTTFSTQTFRARFHEFCLRRRLIEERTKIIVAVSGGVDSMVLLDLLSRERETLGLSLIVAHFNHQLRGQESDDDERFVQDEAQRHGLEYYVERAPTADIARGRKQGVQETARDLRYVFFANLLLSTGYQRIATAHNADDNAETVLLNLVRGAGVAGVAGIPVYRKDRNVVRPLLFAERSDIEEYARTERIAFRTDSSNLTDHYTRNFIRHEIIPSLRANINPTLVQTLQRTSDLFRELDAYLRHNARRTLEVVTTRKTTEDLHISIPGLRSCPVLLQQYVVLFAIEDFTGQRPEYELVDRILGLTEGLTGSWVPLGDDHAAFRDRDTLAIRQVNVEPEYRIIVQQNRTYEFSRFRFASEVLPSLPANRQETGSAEYVDADSVSQGDLVLRTWTDGDAFIPLGMKAMKKVSDFFVDAKVPVYEKRRYPILETQDGRIVWVCGQRIDDRFKITEDTRRVIRLEFTLLENGERVPLHQG